MCYLYLKLRVFLERKVQPKSVLKGVVSFIYSIYYYVCIVKIFYFSNLLVSKEKYSGNPEFDRKVNIT